MNARPLGVTLLALFFGFGTAMCLLTAVLLVMPGSSLDAVWNLNPPARAAFTGMGGWALALMVVVGTACAIASVGLWRGATVGRTTALLVLIANLAGDVGNAVLRHDSRALIGVPIGGVFILYLLGSRARLFFGAQREPAVD